MTATIAAMPPPSPGSLVRPRRILIVVHGYPPNQTMGAEVQTRRKARWWHEQGHWVSVLAADPQPPSRLPFGQREEVVDVVDGISVGRVRFAVPYATRSLDETFAHPLLGGALEEEIARSRPDLVYQVSGYLFGVLPLQIAARLGIPAMLFAMDYWHTCQRVTLLRPDGALCPGPSDPADCAACRLAARSSTQRLGMPANRAIRRVLATTGRMMKHTPLGVALGVADFAARHETIAGTLATVALVVVNSRFLAGQMVRLGVPAERVLVVRQGIDTREFAAPPPQMASQGGLKVLYLGQISWHKGADLAIEAVARLHATGLQARLRLHGPVTAPAPYLAQLQARIVRANQGDEIVTLGDSLDRAGLIAALRAADVLVAPSRWYENSPNVILEAFAAGTPVIAANHGGMAEMVRDGEDGLLFAPGDAASLAAALRHLGVDPALLPRLRAGIRRPHGVAEEMAPEDAAIERIFAEATAPPPGDRRRPTRHPSPPEKSPHTSPPHIPQRPSRASRSA